MLRRTLQIIGIIFGFLGVVVSQSAYADTLNESDTVVVVFKSVKAYEDSHPKFLLMPQYYVKVGVSDTWLTSRSTNNFTFKRGDLDTTAETKLEPIYFPVKAMADIATERAQKVVKGLESRLKKTEREIERTSIEFAKTQKRDWRSLSPEQEKYCRSYDPGHASPGVPRLNNQEDYCHLIDLQEAFKRISSDLKIARANSTQAFLNNQAKLTVELYQGEYLILNILEHLFALFDWETGTASPGHERLRSICGEHACGLSFDDLAKLKNGKMNSYELSHFASTRSKFPDVFTISIGVFSPDELKNIAQILADVEK